MGTQQRIAWADMAIMVSHVFTGHPVSQWLFTFHVPLFFFLSGFLFREGKPLGSFLKGKVRRMLVPYFALALPIIPAEAAMSGPRAGFWDRTLELAVQVLIQKRLWPIWFLACLFLLEIIGYFLIRFIKNDRLLALAAVALGGLGVAYAQGGGEVLPWNLDACFSVLPFFMAGYLLKKWDGKMDAFLTGWNSWANQYGLPLRSYLSAFCGIGAVVLAAKRMTVAPVSYLGRNSLVYFVWHQTPVITAIYYFFPRLGIPMEHYPSGAAMLAEKGLELFLILTVLTILNELLLHSKLKWVLGK